MLSFYLLACDTTQTSQPVDYTGPLTEIEDVEMYYTEKDLIKIKMVAKKVFEYENGDREFPEGIYLEFYNETGAITSTLRANSAYYFSEEDKWRGRGDVEIINIEKKEQLNTEELFWKQDTKRIFTEKFVTIKLEAEVIYGTGLEAAQDLSDYTIKNPQGEFDMVD
ncbi:MAG: LPS export ABC transporter periplasmic protein LptC [Cyclobacteriaceae bacterium]|nr:LPS export ABC transporter periplasmic protein LptC [Cyclobacteriaceae bacterium]